MKLHSAKIFTDENIFPKVVAFRENSDTNSPLIERRVSSLIAKDHDKAAPAPLNIFACPPGGLIVLAP